MHTISVIIATSNRCQSLKDTLDSLLDQEQDESFDYEILVVDNNSKDKTKELVGSYLSKFNGKMKYLFEPRQGKSLALNLGINESKGEIIAFTDDDVIVDKRWLLSFNECFRRHNCDGVGGKIKPQLPANTPRWVKENIELLSGPFVYYNYGDSIKEFNSNYMLPFVGANMAFRRSWFSNFGLFRTDLGPGAGTFGDDSELFFRFQKNKAKFFYCGSASLWHKISKKRANIFYVAKWYIAFGKYKALVEPKNQRNNDCYFRIPRYLFKDCLKHSFILIFKILNRQEFLKTWNTIFIDLGKILGYGRRKCVQ